MKGQSRQKGPAELLFEKSEIRSVSKEAFHVVAPLVAVDREDVASLKNRSASNDRKRMRLCAHGDISAAIHEMMVVLQKESYIRPHRHHNKVESYHIIEGLVDLFIFDENGSVKLIVPMGDYYSGRDFFFRIADPVYHTLAVRSEQVVFHETTSGPFVRSETQYAAWAPSENDVIGVRDYMEKLFLAANILSKKSR